MRMFPPAPMPRGRIRWGAIRLLPLLFFFTYLSATVLVFAFGPWPWPVRDPLKLYGFLVLAHLAVVAGYLGAIRRPARLSRVQWSPRRLLWASVALNLLLLAPTLKFRTSGRVEIVAALTDPGRAYYRASSPTDSYENRYVEYVRVLFGPVLGLLLPLSVVYWRRLGRSLRICAVAAIVGELCIWFATARNKGVADLVFVLPWLVLVAQSERPDALVWKRIVRMTAVFIMGGVFFAGLFTWFVSSRYAAKTVALYDDGARIEARQILQGADSQFANNMILGLTTYLSQGYYALSLALDEPFVPTWGLGSSTYLMTLAEKLSGREDLHEKTYPARIAKYGWDALGRFHTFYLWVASDVSFPGTIVIMYVLGRLLAVCWVNAVDGANPLAVALLANVLIVFYYIPANNQVMQYPEQMTAFWVTLAVWWLTTYRRRRERGDSSESRFPSEARGEAAAPLLSVS